MALPRMSRRGSREDFQSAGERLSKAAAGTCTAPLAEPLFEQVRILLYFAVSEYTSVRRRIRSLCIQRMQTTNCIFGCSTLRYYCPHLSTLYHSSAGGCHP